MASTDTQAQGSYLGHPSPTVEDIESFPRIKTGIETTHDTTDPVLPEIKTDDDPFSGHRQEVNPFAENGVEKNEAVTSGSPTSPVDRRTSTDEWGEFVFYVLDAEKRWMLIRTRCSQDSSKPLSAEEGICLRDAWLERWSRRQELRARC